MHAYLRQIKPKLTTYLFRHGSRLVDMDWYCSQTPLQGVTKRFALLHYWLFGANASAQCHPLFDNNYFSEQCKNANLPIPRKPLKTYLSNRSYWRINPHPLFDANFYLQQAGNELDQSPLMHYINNGHTQHDPHPLFQHAWYFISFPNLKAMQQHCPLVHYMKIGYGHAVSTHPLFHAEFYAAQTNIPVINNKTDTNTLLHFVTNNSDTISCHPLFDIAFFSKQISETNYHSAAHCIINHYLLQQKNWKYNTHILFDASFYNDQSTGIQTEKSPLEEYVARNFSKRNPHPLFSTQWYQKRKKNILKFTGQSRVPLVHFVLNGYRMGESPHPLFSLQWYRHTYLQGKLDNTNPLIEFIQHGEAAGNRPNPLYPSNWQEWLQQKHACNTLSEFSKKYTVTLPNFRNRISDAFSITYIDEETKKPRNYLILFTPRSGSSWLTDLIHQQKTLGKPAEWFNPDLIQSAMKNLQHRTHNIHEYCEELQNTHQSAEGFFGAELAASHLSLLTDLIDIQKTFNNPLYILLLRKNIVAQGISLFLATETGFFHATNTINQENSVDYNEKKIKKWITEILHDEKTFNNFINRTSCNPVLIWHEDLKNNTEKTMKHILKSVTGKDFLAEITTEKSSHTKISTEKNRAFEERFRQENRVFIESVTAARPFTQ